MRKDQNFAVRIFVHEQGFQGAEFRVFARLPFAELRQQVEQDLGIGGQALAEGVVKMVRGQPAEPTCVRAGKARVDRGCAVAKIPLGPQRCRLCGFPRLLVIRIKKIADSPIRVLVKRLRIQKPRISRSYRKRQVIFKGVQKNEVPQDVPFDRQQKGVAATLQAFE